MPQFTLITGGVRSGKSALAEQLADAHTTHDKDQVLYVATALPSDPEMSLRIEKHRATRPATWVTIERHRDLAKLITNDHHPFRIVIVDCITLLVTNLLLEEIGLNPPDELPLERYIAIEEAINTAIDALLNDLAVLTAQAILVTNEVGWGIIPANLLSRMFCDILGRINQKIARKADQVYLVVAGVPMLVKAHRTDRNGGT